MPDFSDSERKILDLFKSGTVFNFKGNTYSVVKSGKPRPSSGECKTDIYILASNIVDSSDKLEIKISYKKENADFVENKIKAERAEEIFGTDWADYVKLATNSIKAKFLSTKLIYKEAKHPTEKGSFTVGWKFEFVNKPGGLLSGKLQLSNKQLADIYSGTKLPLEKKNSCVNNEIVKNSGVANYILISDDLSSAQEIINSIITIDKYVLNNPEIYYACKALNYRSFDDKIDGNRPLAVQVKWKADNGKLSFDLDFDHPLTINGYEMRDNLKECLKKLGIKNTDDLTLSNVDDRFVFKG